MIEIPVAMKHCIEQPAGSPAVEAQEHLARNGGQWGPKISTYREIRQYVCARGGWSPSLARRPVAAGVKSLALGVEDAARNEGNNAPKQDAARRMGKPLMRRNEGGQASRRAKKLARQSTEERG